MRLTIEESSPGFDARQFRFGQRWRMNNDVVYADDSLFPSANRDESKKKVRTVVVVQDGPLNESPAYWLIRVAPVTTDVLLLQPTDIKLTSERDGVKHECYVRLSHVQSVLKNDLVHQFDDISEEAQKEIISTELWLLGQLDI